MGNYKCRREGFLQAWQMKVAELTFQGCSDEEIIERLWFVTPDDPKKMKNARNRLRNCRRNEKFQEYYKSIITEWTVHNVGKALTKLSEQIDSDKPWIANKAANDVLLHSKTFIAPDDNTVVIKVEGMPELGSPEE